MIVAAVLISFLAPPQAHAQKLYRCGSVFSDVPCSPDAQALKSTPAMSTSAGSGAGTSSTAKDIDDRVQGMCNAALRESLKDTSSLVQEGRWRYAGSDIVKLSEASETDTHTIGAINAEAIVYSTMTNAKNSYGAMTGMKVTRCLLNSQKSKVLQINRPES